MSVVAVPKILREKLTDEGAEALVNLIDSVEEKAQKVVLEMAEERFEKRVAQVGASLETKIAQTEARLETKIAQTEGRLQAEIAKTEGRLQAQIAKTEGQLEAKIAQVDAKVDQAESRLEVKIAQTETRLVRWMFAFWVGQFASIVGTLTAILFAFFKP